LFPSQSYGGQRAVEIPEPATLPGTTPRPAGRSPLRIGPGPRAGSRSSPPQARAVHCPVGPIAVKPTCRRCCQSGRRDSAARQVWVLTRIRVGAAVTAGPGRGPVPGPPWGRTSRLGSVTLQRPPARAGFPVPFRFCRGTPVTPGNVRPSCTLVGSISLRGIDSTAVFALSVAFPALLLHPLQHPCPTRCFFCSDLGRRQASPSAGHYPAGPAGRLPPPSRPAGRNRPRGPVLLYTVRRDLDGHGAHDVTGGRSPLVLAGPPPGREGTCRSGWDPAASSCGRVTP